MQSKNAIRVALFGLGFLSIGTQIFLMREFLSAFYGNELILGIALAIWMLITGLGAYAANFLKNKEISNALILFLLLLFGALPLLMVSGLDLLKSWFFPYGSMISLWGITVTSALILLPFCLLNGFLFTALSDDLYCHSEKTLQETKLQEGCATAGRGAKFLAMAYAYESLGSMVAGGLVNFLFLWFFNTYQNLAGLTIFYLVLVLIFAFAMTSRARFFVLLLCASLIAGTFIFIDFKGFSERLRYPDQHILANQSTPYGQVVITENHRQLNFYENGILLSSSGNEINNEEKIHFAMIQHPDPKYILLISGGFSGTISEVLKYRPDRIDYVEMNPSLIGIASAYTNQLMENLIFVHNKDPRWFVRFTKTKFDIVIIDLPEPSTLQVNRFYSHEFFADLKKILNPGAVISLSLPTTSDYISREAGRLNASVYNTLKKTFKYVLPVPVERNFFLGSDSLLDIHIPELVMKKGIPTVFVNPYYLDGSLLQQRSDYILRNISPDIPVNSDFKPVALVYQLQWWIRIFPVAPWQGILVLAAMIVILLITLNPVSVGMFTGGFTLASTEIILIIALQVLSGYIYQMLGMIFMLFMLGLAMGSILSSALTRIQPFRFYLLTQTLLAVYSLLMPFILHLLYVSPISGFIIHFVIAALAFVGSALVGFEYGMAVRLSSFSPRKTAAVNYSADLFGSAAGAFLVTIYLFPILGLTATGLILSFFNLFSAAYLLIRRRFFVFL